MAYIHMYDTNPTVNLTDGTLVSESGLGTHPILIILNATNNEISSGVKLAIRTETGFQTTSGVNTSISIIGTNSNKWALSLDNITWEAYGSPLTLTAQITPINKILYVRAKSTSDEIPMNDISVSLSCVSQIEAI